MTKRPWQGTLLGVLAIIGAVSTLLLAATFLIGGGFLDSFLASTQFADKNNIPPGALAIIKEATVVFGLFFVAIGTLDIFIARGFFKGQKWAVILIAILHGISIIGLAGQLFSHDGNVARNLTSLIVVALLFWIDIICWQHPYYNQKKK